MYYQQQRHTEEHALSISVTEIYIVESPHYMRLHDVAKHKI